ncbi:hypothetical protein K461DRAFT_103762 [Myriangium duriaei CBS 260.36]|uniref:Nudix hydrolase domain-containing protein n=1 Tax=Myriangium duriaei CBS 260.36 TaxID=1168546 RepID=A0A9P4J9G0_9PEZI|nr:hypothetical protein K461DRAFT_103762 [Myriangium duriaei CBS 260.36]
MADNNDSATPLTSNLCSVLSRLSSHPFPSIASPEKLKKRASVALVIRISPSFSEWPPASLPEGANLESFFAQPWVRQGKPEVLFIKRAARKGDRWTSHVALPGGKRDPEDADDLAAAVRETWEEVGLDVSPSNPHVLQTGNLPQRVITTQWGKVPLMVLCPYIFLITRHGTPPLRLQPSEVASCHWVPLVELLHESNRTTRREDVGARFANQETGVRKWILDATIGQMIFSAIQLKPSETVMCTASPAEQQARRAISIKERFWRWFEVRHEYDTEPPLLLWGLTLGVLADFLDLHPPHNAFSLWSYPTFTPWDIRFVIWAMTYRFKRRKETEVRQIRDHRLPAEAVELGLEAVSMPADEKLREAGISGISTGLDSTDGWTRIKASAISTMLDGYYDIVRKAMAIALICRSGTVMATALFLAVRVRRWRAFHR